MYQISHFYPAWDHFEVMLVVPKCIWPHPLLVHKKLAVFYVRDFCHPKQRDAQNGGYGVGDDLSGVHFSAGKIRVRSDVEAHFGGGYFLEIHGVGEKIPG